MLDIVDIYKETKGCLFEKTNILDDKDIFIIHRGDYFDNLPRRYFGIQKFNTLSSKIEKFKFNKSVNFVSDTNLRTTASYTYDEEFNGTIYYGNINDQTENYSINLYKVNCNSWKEEAFFDIDTGIKKREGYEDKISLILETKLVNIDERYCMVFVPNIPGYTRTSGIFYDVLLVDFFEKRVYKVPKKIARLDWIFRIDEMFVVNNRRNILIKTLRINSSEKQCIWKRGKENKNFKENNNFLESLVMLETEKFINQIKSGVNISDDSVMEVIDLKGSLEIIYVDKKKVIYYIKSFENNTTCIKEYYFESCKTSLSIINGLYDNIKYFKNKLYNLSSNYLEKKFVVYDIYTKKKMVDSKELVVYIDDNIYISEKRKKGDFNKLLLTIYDLNNNILNVLECSTYYFYYEEDRLVLI